MDQFLYFNEIIKLQLVARFIKSYAWPQFLLMPLRSSFVVLFCNKLYIINIMTVLLSSTLSVGMVGW